MQADQIQNFIDNVNPNHGQKIVVTFLNSASFYGFFFLFNDWIELKKYNKWRFIPYNKFIQFDHEFQVTNIPNIDYSIIIDGDHVSNLETIMSYSVC